MHTSSPITCDFGKYYSSANAMMIGDDELDLFVFLGSPKEVLNEYTNVTGKSPMPPLWSFGLWMSRCTYSKETEVREVAAKLRQNKIPCDVIHWGGDAESTDGGMAADLRAGLSLGLCGFSFWSHDVGGFVSRASEDLYRRWLAFGMLTSHSRCHGTAPKEPWNYSQQFMDDFRVIDELKYKLMPYVYAQAKDCSERGLPMLRALFVEYPDDPGSWLVDDEYLFGSDVLVAPLLESGTTRAVYLPPGKWIDYQTWKAYVGGWNRIQADRHSGRDPRPGWRRHPTYHTGSIHSFDGLVLPGTDRLYRGQSERAGSGMCALGRPTAQGGLDPTRRPVPPDRRSAGRQG